MKNEQISVRELLGNPIRKRIYARPLWNNTGIVTEPGFRIEIRPNPAQKWKTLDMDWVDAEGYVQLCNGHGNPPGTMYGCTISGLRLGAMIGKIGSQYQITVGLFGQIDLSPTAPREALELAINQYGNDRAEGFIDVDISSFVIPH